MADGDSRDELTIEVRSDSLPLRLIVIGVCIQLGLVLLDFYGSYANLDGPGPLRRLFSLAREDSLGAWFSVTQTMLAALVAWALAFVERSRGRNAWRHWVVVGAFLTYMAADDGAAIHERIGSVFSALGDGAGTASLGVWLVQVFPSYAWQVVYVPIFGVLGVLTAWLIWRTLTPSPRRFWPLVTLACWGAAVVLDFFEGLDPDHAWNLHEWFASSFDIRAYVETRFNVTPFDAVGHFQRVLEETLEMFGMTLLLAALVACLAKSAHGIRIRCP